VTLPDFTASRLGQINTSGDALALFLKVFSGEVLATFQNSVVTNDKHIVRSISQGKSAQFPVLGTNSARYHTPGTMIDGNAIPANEKVINIDGLLISPAFIANIDEAMNHYDVRGQYAELIGKALAIKFDKQVLQVGCLAARASATITGGNGGSILTNAQYDTDGVALAEGLFDAAQALDEKNVPAEDRNFFVRPKHYYLLARNPKVLDRDWGGSGAYSDGTVFRIAGINVVMTNNLPNTNIAADNPAPNNTYDGDFSNTVGLLMHKSAVGTVKLRDVAMESAYLVQNQGTLMVGKLAVGHGILRPESAVEFKKA
jgi:hypothetical protein